MPAQEVEVIERSFDVAGQANLKLTNIAGKIEIQPGEEGRIQVTAVKHLDSIAAGQTQIVMEQEESGRVLVETRQRGMWVFFNFGKPAEVDYKVLVPPQCVLKVNGVSSLLSVRELAGDLDLGSVSGEITVESLDGKLNISTVSGEVSAGQLSGALRLNTVSGSVDIRASRLDEVSITTVSGNVFMQSPLGQGSYHFDSVSGEVRLMVPPETGCELVGNSVSGEAVIYLPVEQRSQGRGHWHVVVQQGGPKVSFHSVSGNFVLSDRESGEMSSPTNSSPTNSQAEAGSAAAGETTPEVVPSARMEVLDRIARGELSVEEAIKELKS